MEEGRGMCENAEGDEQRHATHRTHMVRRGNQWGRVGGDHNV